MVFKKGDIVQIIDEEHPWYAVLMIVKEPKSWGFQGYVLMPSSNDGSVPARPAFNRLKTRQVEKVGTAAVLWEAK